ncbi:MAG: hypothetical protein QOE77_3424 [Blastocatellia bacterium]|jgi:hypothetical protein|nr:hypothetical protein [Blastocatellia bacterium]
MKRKIGIGICLTALFLASAVLTISRGFSAAGRLAGLDSGAASIEPGFEPAAVAENGLEVQVLVNGVTLEEYLARGRRYVEALEGAEYEISLRNTLPVRVAVALSVDGLNSIDAKHATAWDSSKWVIGPYQTIRIGGWQMSSERARRFYFTTERDSYAAKLGQTANLGLISAVFFRERTRTVVPITPPRVEPLYRDDGVREERDKDAKTKAPSAAPSAGTLGRSNSQPMPVPDDESAATGIGRSVRNDVRWVSLDLDPRPAGAVNIRYEYRASLVRLGILPRPYPRPDVLGRRERAQGFEGGYCPEP